MRLSHIFRSVFSKEMKAKINKLDCIKLKNFQTVKEINKMKGQSTEWEKIFANKVSDKGC